jgi:lysophospholipase L1-like esterase
MQLNLADRVRGYRVVNLGRSGANSSMVLNQTVRYLAKAERTPDVIIFNAGFNNCWNFEEASVLPRNIAAGSLHAQFRYLAAQSRLLRFSRITVSRIEQLARSSESQISDAQSSQILNVHDETEIAFLTDWVYRDLVRLDREARGKGARLVLLSYWNNIRWVDAAFRRMTQTQGAPLIDVHNFGEPTTESWNTRPVALAAPDFHPNKYGYARIAQLVAQALFDRGLIPPAQAPKVR